LPIAVGRRTHRDLCVGNFYRAIRLMARPAQRVRHRGVRISLDFGSVAELAAARPSGTLCRLWRGLSSSNRNNSHQNYQDDEQQRKNTFSVHDSVEIHSLRQAELYLGYYR
jgi:hypothetical protein